MNVEEEAAALVIDMDEHPAPDTIARVARFCEQSEYHRAVYEALQRTWDSTSILQLNRVLQ